MWRACGVGRAGRRNCRKPVCPLGISSNIHKQLFDPQNHSDWFLKPFDWFFSLVVVFWDTVFLLLFFGLVLAFLLGEFSNRFLWDVFETVGFYGYIH